MNTSQVTKVLFSQPLYHSKSLTPLQQLHLNYLSELWAIQEGRALGPIILQTQQPQATSSPKSQDVGQKPLTELGVEDWVRLVPAGSSPAELMAYVKHDILTTTQSRATARGRMRLLSTVPTTGGS